MVCSPSMSRLVLTLSFSHLRERMYVVSNVLWQAILNLRGFAENHLVLTGTAMNEEEFLALTADPKHASNNIVFYYIRAFLYAIFAEHQLGADHAVANSKWLFANNPSYPALGCTAYYMGLSLVDTAERTKKSVYKKYAKQMFSKIKAYIRKGNPNVWHYRYALAAEMQVLDHGKAQLAGPKFESAISFATRGGFIHDAALINERYGRFLLRRLKDKEKGMYHLDKSLQLYSEWGSQQKADMLHAEFRDQWPSPKDIITRPSSSSMFFSDALH
jgi:hypothetical protein